MAEQPSQQAVLRGFPVANTNPPSGPGKTPAIVTFDRKEFTTILQVFSRKVAEGEWRDYALDFLRDRAMFSIYRRTSERPLYMIEKVPRLRERQGQYVVSGQNGRILRRGHDLAQVLRVLDARLVLVR